VSENQASFCAATIRLVRKEAKPKPAPTLKNAAALHRIEL
jgi:hypothetical protein